METSNKFSKNCMICNKIIHHSEVSSRHIQQITENAKICQKFCIFACRILDFHNKLFEPEKTIKNCFVANNILQACEVCFPILEAVSQLYNQYNIIQLQLIWGLTEVSNIMRVKKEVNIEKNYKDVKHSEVEFFKEIFLEKVAVASKTNPEIKLAPTAKKKIKPIEDVEINLESRHQSTFKIKPPELGKAKDIFPCTFCRHRCSQLCGLDSHLRTHTLEKPFLCKICGGEFAQERTLNDHMRIHTRLKPFLCETCGATFTQNGSLIKHKRIHLSPAEGKLFKCSFCGRCFTQKMHRNYHEISHTGEKAYKCDKCGDRFSRSYTLKRHMQRRHIKQPTPAKREEVLQRKKPSDLMCGNNTTSRVEITNLNAASQSFETDKNAETKVE